VIVVDASVLAPALAEDGIRGELARARLRGEQLAAPELVDLEVAAVLRRMALRGLLDGRRAQLALADLVAVPMERAAHAVLLPRIWELRDNLSAYDAAYVALAELAGATLVTADGRLARSPGMRCAVEHLS
jgi:predicted nucleic acid-binding protein